MIVVERLIPFFDMVALDYTNYDAVKEVIIKYGLRPSGALHVMSMGRKGAIFVGSKDEELDKIPWVRRLWLGARYETPI